MKQLFVSPFLSSFSSFALLYLSFISYYLDHSPFHCVHNNPVACAQSICAYMKTLLLRNFLMDCGISEEAGQKLIARLKISKVAQSESETIKFHMYLYSPSTDHFARSIPDVFARLICGCLWSRPRLAPIGMFRRVYH
jgi:hypothetical protein